MFWCSLFFFCVCFFFFFVFFFFFFFCFCFFFFFFFFQAEDGIRDADVTGVQTCALPICLTFIDIKVYLVHCNKLLATFAKVDTEILYFQDFFTSWQRYHLPISTAIV